MRGASSAQKCAFCNTGHRRLISGPQQKHFVGGNGAGTIPVRESITSLLSMHVCIAKPTCCESERSGHARDVTRTRTRAQTHVAAAHLAADGYGDRQCGSTRDISARNRACMPMREVSHATIEFACPRIVDDIRDAQSHHGPP